MSVLWKLWRVRLNDSFFAVVESAYILAHLCFYRHESGDCFLLYIRTTFIFLFVAISEAKEEDI